MAKKYRDRRRKNIETNSEKIWQRSEPAYFVEIQGGPKKYTPNIKHGSAVNFLDQLLGFSSENGLFRATRFFLRAAYLLRFPGC